MSILLSSGEFRGELAQVTKEGREVIVDARATLIRNEDGTPRSVLGINTDITEQKKLETQLLRAQRLESIGILASGVAHDLNNSVNARDAMPNSGKLSFVAANLEIDKQAATTTPDATPGPHVLLQISDTGSGMPQETIAKIFDPFFTTKDPGRGTGLGLSTAIGIVKSHGGFISVQSELGQGTIFKIFLPAEVSAQSLAPSKTRVALARGNGELVLVVDDEENILRTTKAALEKHNYRVISVSDGTEALALFAQQMEAIKVVLTDIAMPHMDGVTAIRALRKMKPDVPIIAFTGETQRARLEELRAMNVSCFLIKPFSRANLLAAVHTSIGPCNEVEAECRHLFERTDLCQTP